MGETLPQGNKQKKQRGAELSHVFLFTKSYDFKWHERFAFRCVLRTTAVASSFLLASFT
jgi:hypothetical protein